MYFVATLYLLKVIYMLKYLLLFIAILSLTACGQVNSNKQNTKLAQTVPLLTKDQKMDIVFPRQRQALLVGCYIDGPHKTYQPDK
jgi:outer membrane biogenesis lipoprotein LolB